MVMIALVRYGWTWPTFPRSHYWSGFAGATLIHLAVLYFGGLYDRDDRLGTRSWLPRTAGLSLVAVLIDAAAATGIGRFLMPRLNLVALFIVGSIMLAANRHLARRLRNSRYGRPRVLLVGRPDDIGVAERQLGMSGSEAVITGRISADVSTLGASLLDTVEQSAATEVLLLTGGAVDSIYPEPLGSLEQQRINVYHRLTPGDTLLGVRRSRQIAGMPFVALGTHSLSDSQRRLKRTSDLVLVVAVLPILVPMTLIAWLISVVATRQGRLVRTTRVGRDNEPFTLYSLASTPALRRWRLDALPQWINILRGDMSLVGPRHESPDVVERFSRIIPGYNRRHEIAPGAIGLAKVRGGFRSDPGVELNHDLHYLVNWSPMFDLQVVGQTIWQLATTRFQPVAATTPERRPATVADATVSVALAALNEERTLAAAVSSIQAQTHPHLDRIIIAVAPSRDRTREIADELAAQDGRIIVIDNPESRTPHGFNLAAAEATSDYIAFMNAHCEVDDDYLAIGTAAAAATGAANVGGRQFATGDTWWEQEVAAALNSPIGAGDARHHYDETPGEIESVPLGIFRRSVFEDHGGFDEALDRNQDYELNWRIRQGGDSIWFDPRIIVTYRPRRSWRALARQYFDYGRYKQRVLRMWPSSFRWHHLAPPTAVLALVASVVGAIVWTPWCLAVPVAYLSAVVLATIFTSRRPDGRRGGIGAMAAVITMHIAWGTGLLLGARRRR